MSPQRSSSCDQAIHASPGLDAAVPAQEPAKSALRRELAVFRAQRGAHSLACHPVLLCGNHPGRVPTALVHALAAEVGLPCLEVSASHGVCIGQIVSQLARSAPECRENHPLGIALLNDLQHVSPASAQALTACISATESAAYVHDGRVLHLSARQVFWVGAMQVREPSRTAPRGGRFDGGASFALFAVGPSASDVVAAGVAGPMSASSPDAEQLACLEALGKAFKVRAWLLPGTPDDLVAWARAESAPWWPGRRLRAFCEGHGVGFVMGQGAAEALAAEAGRCGGTADAMEDLLRDAMEPVLDVIADSAQAFSTVEVTPAAVALTEAPRLIAGPRRPIHSVEAQRPDCEGASASGFNRPARTPHSATDVRLARAQDLAGLLSPLTDPPTDTTTDPATA